MRGWQLLKRRTAVVCLAMGAAALLPALAQAAPLEFDASLSPASFSALLGVGESLTITKTLTVGSGPDGVIQYETVGLDLSEAPAGVSLGASPGVYNGPFDTSETRSFAFDVTFTGLTAGTHDFNIYGLVYGVRAGMETDRIVVTNGGTAPEPGTLALLGLGLAGLAATRRRKQ